MSWLFSQALVEEYSAASCSDGEPSAQLSVMPTQHKFWRNDKMMEFSKLSQFGLTCAVLTASRGEELLTLFLAAFHAKTLAQQEKAQESQVKEVDYGKSSHGLLAKYNPDTHSWKTAQCSLFEDLEQSLEIWPRWGSMRNGVCYLLPMLAQTIKEKESRYWATPTTMDKLPPKSIGALERESTITRPGRTKPANLRDQVSNMQNWPTPRACKAQAATLTEKMSNHPHLNLEVAVAKQIWPTPAATDGTRGGMMTENMTGQSLTQMVNSSVMWPTPCASEARQGL